MPPAPIVPAIAEYSIMAMVLIVRPPTRAGIASASCAVRTICSRDAPDARATRAYSGGTARSEFSTMRLKNAMPASDIGTIAAGMPMFVPVTNCVNGMIAAIRMRNGSDRPRLTTQPTAACTARCS